MLNEIEIGEYVRSDKGYIWKETSENFSQILTKDGLVFGNLVKHSKNIIDLIEVGDYVNGERVLCFRNNDCDYDIGTEYNDEFGEYFGINLESIKTIVTKEMYKSVEYKVGM